MKPRFVIALFLALVKGLLAPSTPLLGRFGAKKRKEQVEQALDGGEQPPEPRSHTRRVRSALTAVWTRTT